MEGKYRALKKTNQRLEAHILKLYNQLEQQGGGATVPVAQSAIRTQTNSKDRIRRDTPIGQQSPLSSWSMASTITSSQESIMEGSPKRTATLRFSSEIKAAAVEPVRPLFNVNSPSTGISFSSASPFKKFHDQSHKANTLPILRGDSDQPPRLAKSYPPPGNIGRPVSTDEHDN